MGDFEIFVGVLVATMVVVRLIVLIQGNRSTLIHKIRVKSHLYLHHIYIGIFIMAICAPFIFFGEISKGLLVFFTVGLSLSLDEIMATLFYGNYPNKREFGWTVLLYLVVIVYSFVVMRVL